MIFLLSTFSSSGELSVADKVKLPSARNVQALLAAPLVAVSGDAVYVDARPAGTLLDVYSALERGQTRAPATLSELRSKLASMKDTWASTHPAGAPFPRTVVLQLDENLPAFVVKSVFFTCPLAGYDNISFMVNKRASSTARFVGS